MDILQLLSILDVASQISVIIVILGSISPDIIFQLDDISIGFLSCHLENLVNVRSVFLANASLLDLLLRDRFLLRVIIVLESRNHA